jgi:hypothetical protein
MTDAPKGTDHVPANSLPSGKKAKNGRRKVTEKQKADFASADAHLPHGQRVPKSESDAPVQPTFSVAGNVGNKDLDPADRKLVEAGRNARLNGVAREDSPKSGKENDLWLEGWDSVG